LRVRHSLVQVDQSSQGGRDALQQHLENLRSIRRNARPSLTSANQRDLREGPHVDLIALRRVAKVVIALIQGDFL
jgi:hypothetical protein